MALSEASVPAIAARGIRKSFGAVEVLHGIDFDLQPGEIHGLAGANGAGKSTLMKILNGVYPADAGSITVSGKKAAYRNPIGAREAGIAMVFQEFSLVPTMSASQNIFLGREPRTAGALVDDRTCESSARQLFADIGVAIDPDIELAKLSVGSQQVVEIAKALSREPAVLILDEPTASLSHGEIQALFALLRRLKAKGAAIVMVTHHLREIMEICDRVTVIRDGRVALSEQIEKVVMGDIIAAMIGGKAGRGGPEVRAFGQAIRSEGPPSLEVRDLSVPGKVEGLSFSARAGEVLGLAGVLGSGRTEALKAVYGSLARSAGSILIDGKEARIDHPARARQLGVALVPENRRKDGIIAIHSVAMNMLLPVWKALARFGLVNDGKGRALAQSLVERLHIKTESLDQAVGTLSGGNQQKTVIAKSIAGAHRVILLDEPTVGVDVASKAEIAKAIGEFADEGSAVVVVSSEFEELEALCDRVLVLRRGRLVAEFDRAKGDVITEAALIAASQG